MVIHSTLAAEDRREALRVELHQRGSIELDDAALLLGVHVMTVRRDLDYLEAQGQARRVRGGAVAVIPEDFQLRLSHESASKRLIANKLIPLVPRNLAVCMDASTTIHELARLVGSAEHLSVITNGLATFQILQHRRGISVYLTGGESEETNLSLVGPMAVRAIEGFNVARSFLSSTALDAGTGTSEPSVREAEVKVSMASTADHVVLAIDSTKLGKRSLARGLPFSSIDLLATELDPRDERLDAYRDVVELL